MPRPRLNKFESPPDPKAVFEQLRPNNVCYSTDGMSYKIVRVEDGKVWAVWRQGHVGAFGREVVELTRAHVRGFRVRPRVTGAPRRSGAGWPGSPDPAVDEVGA